MRILHLDSGHEMRGGQWQALRLHCGLATRGHESLLLAREGSPLMAEARRAGSPCKALGALSLPGLSRSFDLVHAHDARSHTLAAVLTGRPLVVSRRVAFPVHKSLASKWKYRRPALFLAVSQFVAGQLRSAGVADFRIEVVYDGIPVPCAPAHGDAILVPATHDPQKGMALAMEAAELGRVRLQPSSNLEKDLPGAGSLLYLSHSEGLGSGILLGMAHGVTVIASATGGIPELIEDGVNGILTPNDPIRIAGCFGRIDRRIGAAARQTVMERFTVDRMVETTIAAYAKVLENA